MTIHFPVVRTATQIANMQVVEHRNQSELSRTQADAFRTVLKKIGNDPAANSRIFPAIAKHIGPGDTGAARCMLRMLKDVRGPSRASAREKTPTHEAIKQTHLPPLRLAPGAVAAKAEHGSAARPDGVTPTLVITSKHVRFSEKVTVIETTARE